MADERPLLVFLTGPQKGQRIALSRGPVVAGRSPEAGIVLTEEYVSREQMRFSLLEDGWAVEDLSSRRLRINDKRYGKGKRVLLDTGDILGVGLETQILFVAGGDDPEEAIAATFGGSAGAVEELEAPPAEVIGEVEPGPEPDQKVALFPVAAEAKAGQAEEETKAQVLPGEEEVLTDEEMEAREHRAKMKKYLIFGSIYGVVLVGFIVFMARRGGDEGARESLKPPDLTQTQIERIVDGGFRVTPNEIASRRALTRAMQLWRARRVDPGNLYRCVTQFKRALAYSPTGALHDPEQSRIFLEAKKELKKKLWNTYEEGLIYCRAKAWPKAKFLFDRLLLMVPAKENPRLERQRDDVLFKNIVDYITYVDREIEAAKKSR